MSWFSSCYHFSKSLLYGMFSKTKCYFILLMKLPYLKYIYGSIEDAYRIVTAS